jgi:UDPglucose 6-dehydrogenase
MIGVIGMGVVGTAVHKAFSSIEKTVGYDKYKDSDSFEEILKTDIAFVCVPSPTINNKQDLSDLIEVLHALSEYNYKGIVCVKCTVLPGSMRKFSEDMPNLRLTHNPEFLTAANPYEDFINQKSVIISGPNIVDVSYVKEAYERLLQYAMVSGYSTFEITEIAKYMRNVYLAVKVTFANEVYELCQDLNVDYNYVKDAMLSQGGIEKGHWSVPGPDGKFGYSGMCFPKDQRALATLMDKKDLICNVIKAAEETNQQVRPHDGLCKEIV